MEKLLEYLNNGGDVKFVNIPKRVTLPDGDRDWAVRVCWKAVFQDKKYECEWEGFDTAEECIEDFLLKATGFGKDAYQEATRMFGLPTNEIPEPAWAFAQHLSSKSGLHSEMLIMAYCYYNQAMIGMSVHDDQYEIEEEALEWFKAKSWLEVKTK